MAVTITKENFQSEVLQSDKPVIIDFWASWCNPCKMMAPIVDELSNELSGKVKVCKLNVDDEPDVASKFSVMSIPTLVLVKDGKTAASAVGARPKDDVKRILGI